MRKSFNYNHHSPLHRRQSQRRLLKKFAFIAGMLAWMMLIIFIIFMFIWASIDELERTQTFRLAMIYLGLAAGGFVMRRLMLRLIDAKSAQIRGGGQPVNSAPSQPDKGSVLVMVLVITALVAGLVLEAQIVARLSHRTEGAHVQQTRLRLAATDAIRNAMQHLANDEDLGIDHLDEDWAQPIDQVDPSGIATRVRILDENRYFDLNNFAIPERTTLRPPREILKDILTLCGDFTPGSRVAKLQDWIDEDDQGFHESAHYRELDAPYRPANRALLGWNELLWADGIEREDFARKNPASVNELFQGSLAETVTLLPVFRESILPININTANEDTLLGVMGIENDDLMRRVVNFRKLRPLRQADAASLAIDPNLVELLAPYISVQSSFFRVQAVSYLEDTSTSIEALVRRDNKGNVQVLQWVM